LTSADILISSVASVMLTSTPGERRPVRHREGRELTEPRSRWSMIVVFALLGAVTQVLWVTYAPVTDAAGRYYDVGDGAIAAAGGGALRRARRR
jgi:hypothetical protein